MTVSGPQREDHRVMSGPWAYSAYHARLDLRVFASRSTRTLELGVRFARRQT